MSSSEDEIDTVPPGELMKLPNLLENDLDFLLLTNFGDLTSGLKEELKPLVAKIARDGESYTFQGQTYPMVPMERGQENVKRNEIHDPLDNSSKNTTRTAAAGHSDWTKAKIKKEVTSSDDGEDGFLADFEKRLEVQRSLMRPIMEGVITKRMEKQGNRYTTHLQRVKPKFLVDLDEVSSKSIPSVTTEEVIQTSTPKIKLEVKEEPEDYSYSRS